jgi:hypothetical protein
MEYGFTSEGSKVLETGQIQEEQQIQRQIQALEEFDDLEQSGHTLPRSDNQNVFSKLSFEHKFENQNELSPDMQFSDVALSQPPKEQQYVVSEQKTEQHIVDAPGLAGIATRGVTYNPMETTITKTPVEPAVSDVGFNKFAKPVSPVDDFYASIDNKAKDYYKQQETETEDDYSPLMGKSLAGRYG